MKYLNFGIGDKIPEFSLKDADGDQVNIRDFMGKCKSKRSCFRCTGKFKKPIK